MPATPAMQSLNLTKEYAMNANVGSVDRLVRIIVGLALIGATLGGLIGPWGWLGVVPLLTGFVRFCPAYLPFGWSTCSRK
jgi:hypothetical protein